MRVHYPRTPHLPWSPGATADDVRTTDLSGLAGREVVVTEKLDGENTTLYRDGLHARSLDSAHHPSRAWVKSLHGNVSSEIPAGWRVCGENMYARHSLAYDDLDSWFYAFSVWAEDRCLSWDATVRFASRLGMPVPKVLWRGIFDERVLRRIKLDPTRREGYVVRVAEGFAAADFRHSVAKWVRTGHVQTDQHWMLGPVTANGRGPQAALWDVRAGMEPDVAGLLAAVGFPEGGDLGDIAGRLDLLGRRGDARLAGVLAMLLRWHPRRRVAADLVAPLGMRLTRQVADLIGLYGRLLAPFPDDERRTGLTRLALAADLGVLHAVAAAAQPGNQEVDWSALHAEEAGLFGEQPFDPLKSALRMQGLDENVADRCWAEARCRISTAAEAIPLTWRWRSGDFPRLIAMIGPSGSGKSHFADSLKVDEVVSLDALREARGSREDQSDNNAIFHIAARQLERALTGRRTVVWDATSLNRRQRGMIQSVAAKRNALHTNAVLLVPEEELFRRNGARTHAVPPEVLSAQLERFSPPYPGEAHRTWYVGPSGRVEDVAGAVGREEG
ncbi:RNA ligase family protein [Kutzneria buriramensis]|uniref:Putative kinase n=1 Tax=Kutzneria buriramensis TaxID=1045776 RepID=A0A3E0HHC3_9PSEU|nr:RNA ligase family protein [Kutzneria buriramensis]REH44927.1 putative kinase [Kutzneria buriramensis]